MLNILTGSEIVDKRQLRFLDELAETALLHTDTTVRIRHHISYHFQDTCLVSDLSLPNKDFVGQDVGWDRYERILYPQAQQATVVEHIKGIITSVEFSDDALILFCNDSDYFVESLPLPPHGTVGCSGRQIIPGKRLFDGNYKDMRIYLVLDPDFFRTWYHSDDFSGYMTRASVVRQYFLQAAGVSLNEDKLMQHLKREGVKCPPYAFVMHRLWFPHTTNSCPPGLRRALEEKLAEEEIAS